MGHGEKQTERSRKREIQFNYRHKKQNFTSVTLRRAKQRQYKVNILTIIYNIFSCEGYKRKKDAF